MDPYAWFDRELPIIHKGTYFHGTRLHFVEPILRKGLDPKKMRRAWHEQEWEHAKEDNPELKLRDQPKWIYLTSFYGWAYNWAKRIGTDPIVLQIEAPQELQDQFITNLGEFVRVPVVISSKYITVADRNEKRCRKLTAEEQKAEITRFEQLKTKYPERYLEILQTAPVGLVVPWFVNLSQREEDDSQAGMEIVTAGF